MGWRRHKVRRSSVSWLGKLVLEGRVPALPFTQESPTDSSAGIKVTSSLYPPRFSKTLTEKSKKEYGPDSISRRRAHFSKIRTLTHTKAGP